MKKMHMSRVVFTAALLTLSMLGFLNDWLVCGYSLGYTAVSFLLPLSVGGVFYYVEYRFRVLEKLFATFQKTRIFAVAMTIFCSGMAFLLYGLDAFLGIYLPLSYLLCVCAAEADYPDFGDLLSMVSIQTALFYGITLYLTYYAVSALTIAVSGCVLLIRILSNRQGADAWKGIIVLSAVLLFTSAFVPKILDRLMYLAVTPVDFQIYEACMDFWAGSVHARDLFRIYDLGYLAAAYGWLSVLPVFLASAILLISGGRLLQGFQRPMTSLSVGVYLLIALRMASYLAKSVALTAGLGNRYPFFDPSVLDCLFAALVLQPLNPKPLLQLGPDDPDFEAQETAALFLLPDGREGAAQLAHYVFNTENRAAWLVLLRRFWQRDIIGPNDARILLMNGAKMFQTQEYLRSLYPEFYLVGQDSPLVSPELESLCYDETFLDNSMSESKGTKLLRYWGRKKELLIPPFYTGIGAGAFEGNQELEVVSLPNMVQTIGAFCFRDCEHLREAELREGLKSIGPMAFSHCKSLRYVRLPDTVEEIGHDCFADSGLEEVTIATACVCPYTYARTPLRQATLLPGVRAIQAGAFRDARSLRRIRIPDSVCDIAADAFAGCSALEEVEASVEWLAMHDDLYHYIIGGHTP